MNALLLALALSSSTASTPVVVMPAATITAKAPGKMTCGAPQALQNDAVQTVRVCTVK